MFRKPPESPKPPAAMGLLRCLPISTTTGGPTCTLLVIRLQIFSTTTITTVLLQKSTKRPVLHTAKRAPCRREWVDPDTGESYVDISKFATQILDKLV